MPTHEQPQRFTISQFGRLSQLSRKALRLYEERGLLRPSLVDPDNGYRYYDRSQLAVARRISLLRLMNMPLERLAAVLDAWEQDNQAAWQLIDRHVRSVEQQLAETQLAARLLREELRPQKEIDMVFEFGQVESPTRLLLSIRRNIRIPAYHEWIPVAMEQLMGHLQASGGVMSDEPIALYYGPVNEEDDGPVEIGVPFEGPVQPKGEMKVREWPAHRAVTVRTFGEYNEYPKLLEMWNGLARYVDEQGLEPDWDNDMTTYELWHEDRTMTICWPVKQFPEPSPAG